MLIDCLRMCGGIEIHGLLDMDRSRWGTHWDDVPIIGGDEYLSVLGRQGVTHFSVGVGAVGDPLPRRRLFQAGIAAGLTPLTVVHPRAVCSARAALGAGCQIFAGCVVNAGATIGVNAIVNTGAIVEHDCIVGDHAHVATGASLGGSVRVEDGAHVGAGATILQGVVVGTGAIVGAGAAVVHDVPPRTTVVGVPAQGTALPRQLTNAAGAG